MRKFIFICTSNADRSPSMEKYFRENYPQHEYRSAGINQYHTSKKGTHYITQEDINWADFVVYAEDIHHTKVLERMIIPPAQAFIILNCGEYEKGSVNEDYIKRAESKLKSYL